MRVVGLVLLGLLGGLMGGFLIEISVVFGSRALLGEVPRFLIFVGLLPYLLAVVGAIVVPVIDARRSGR